MTPEEAQELAEWGERRCEYLMRRAEAHTPKGREFAAWLESLPPAEAADEVRAYFALCATEDLAGEIAGDLGLDPEVAELIADEIRAARQRLEAATRPFRALAAED